MLDKIFNMGEGKVGWLADQLLNNDKFMAMMQSLMLKSLEFKQAVEGNARTALSTMNVATLEDLQTGEAKVEAMQAELDEVKKLALELSGRTSSLEQEVKSLQARVEELSKPAKTKKAAKKTTKKAAKKTTKKTTKKTAKKAAKKTTSKSSATSKRSSDKKKAEGGEKEKK